MTARDHARMLPFMSELSSQELEALGQMKALLDKGSHYDLLGVSRDASPEEVKLSYYELSRRFHPDRYYRRSVAEQRGMIEEVFTGINRSYELLADEATRRIYDLDLQRTDDDRSESERRSARREREHRARRRQEASEAAVAGGSEEDTDELNEEGTDPDGGRREGSRRVQELRARRMRRAAAKERGQEVSSSSSRMAQGGPARAPKAPRQSSRGMNKLRERMADNIAKAHSYFEDGKSSFEEGRWIKAASSLHLAVEFDPSNKEYKALHEEAQKKAKQSRAAQFINQAESAEGFGGYREAIEHYKRAVECDPPDGLAFYRLGELLLHKADDARTALTHFRQAAAKEPENSRYGIALAELYLHLGMPKNAEREYVRVLEREPKNQKARAGLRQSRR